MNITISNKTRLETVDFSNLLFGTVFSDHMLSCSFTNGKWQNPEILPYGPISFNPGLQVLHYGQSVFEGMKAFKNKNNQVLLFRKEENFKRLNKSAVRLSIPEIPKDIFMQGLNKLISLDRNWCKYGPEYSLYIRPFLFASSECIKASSSNEFKFMIITSPTSTYYNQDLNLIVEEKYTRAAKGGVGFAKAAGNYAASFYPTKIANSKGFQQVIWTDSSKHQFIEECGTMNIWFRIGDKLITPSISDTILSGITRDSIITLARDLQIEVEEKEISIIELLNAYNSGTLIEVFGTGTAVAVSPVRSITYRDNLMSFDSSIDSFALALKEKLQNIQRGVEIDKYGWTSKVV